MAFGGCTALESAPIPAKVISMNGNPYGGLSASQIKLDENNQIFIAEKSADGTLSIYDKEKITLYGVFGATGEYTFIPDILYIADGALAGNAITSVTLPKNFHEIGNYLFMNCDKLANVKIEGILYSIGDYAFYNTDLTEIAIPEDVTTIGDYAFAYCDKLNNVVIPHNVTAVGKYAFAYNTSLSNFSYAENSSVVELGSHLLYNCPNITEVILPAKFKTTAEDLAKYLSPTAQSSYATGAISSYMFAGTGIVHAVLPENMVYYFNEGVFADCKKLETVTFLKNLENPTSYGKGINNWFTGCDNLKYVYVETITSTSAYMPYNLDTCGIKTLRIKTLINDTTAAGFAAGSSFDDVSEDFALYIEEDSYTDIIGLFAKVNTAWTMKIYDKDGNQLFSAEDNGSVAYVKDKDGKVIWSADAQ